MSFVLYFLFPLLLLGAAAALGLATVVLTSSKSSSRNDEGHRQALAMCIALGVPVVAATSFLVSGSVNLMRYYGPFINFLWIWSLAAFLNGALIGWLYYRGKP